MLARKIAKISFEDLLRDKILDIHEAKAQELQGIVEESLEEDINETLKHNKPRGARKNKGFGDAEPKVSSELKRTNEGVSLKVHGVVVNGEGQPHVAWHAMNGGNNTETFKEQRRINIREENRTTIGELSARPFTKYSDEWFTAKVGTRKHRNKARKWYSIMKKNLVSRVDSTHKFRIEVKN